MSHPPDAFPRRLLAEPPAARLAYFTSRVIVHPQLKAVYDTVVAALQQPVGAPLILVVGPTGVGKTTLRRRLEEQLVRAFLAQSVCPPEQIPVASVEALAPENGSFSWKEFYIRLLAALHEPLIEAKWDGTLPERRQRRAKPGSQLPRQGVADLRSAVESCLSHRQPQALLVDEAQHLKKVSSGRRLLDQMDTLKSLASTTNTVHVLLGTYELVGLTQLSGQLSRRSREIHFGRYRYEDPVERQMFTRVLYTFQRQLPLAEEPDLVGAVEELYERSVGCVGVLKGWLTQALAAALAEEAPTVTRQMLDRWGLPLANVLRMAREIAEGEALVRDSSGDHQELRSLLGMEQAAAPAARAAAPSRPGRVGQRKPVRDPVGVEVAHE
ncbi:MAG: AAA family ATPase [Oscillochloris sp.]|nr:AAA family ATPase [Oscillochloris sp.]